jgi:hypothetical protein
MTTVSFWMRQNEENEENEENDENLDFAFSHYYICIEQMNNDV